MITGGTAGVRLCVNITAPLMAVHRICEHEFQNYGILVESRKS